MSKFIDSTLYQLSLFNTLAENRESLLDDDGIARNPDEIFNRVKRGVMDDNTVFGGNLTYEQSATAFLIETLGGVVPPDADVITDLPDEVLDILIGFIEHQLMGPDEYFAQRNDRTHMLRPFTVAEQRRDYGVSSSQAISVANLRLGIIHKFSPDLAATHIQKDDDFDAEMTRLIEDGAAASD